MVKCSPLQAEKEPGGRGGVICPMSYRVLSTQLKNLTSEAFTAEASESRVFSAFCEALSWAGGGRAKNFAVVLVEEGRGKPVTIRSAEDAARSVV